MIIEYDDDTLIKLTPRFETALIELMRAEAEMMSTMPGFDPEDWYWGRCELMDISSRNGFRFDYGPKEDMPEDGLGRFAIVPDD